MKIFGHEPTLVIAVLNAAVLGAATLGFRWLDNEQAGLIVAGINALFAAVNAYAVRPVSPAVFTYAASAIVSILISYGLTITPEQLVSINAIMVATLGLITRGQVTPQSTPVSSETEAAGKPEVQTVATEGS
jgi:hypothetical protein